MTDEPEDRDNGTDPTEPFDPAADLRVMQSEPPHTPEQIAALTALNQAAENYFGIAGVDWQRLEAMAAAREHCNVLGIEQATSARVVRRAALRVGQGVSDV